MVTSATNLGKLYWQWEKTARRPFRNVFLRRFSVHREERTRSGRKRKSNLSDESAKVPDRELELLFQLLIRQSVHQEKFAREEELIW